MTDIDGPTDVSPKVTVAALVAALVTIIVYLAALGGLEVNPLVQGAITTVLSAGAGYFKNDPLRGTGKRVAGRS